MNKSYDIKALVARSKSKYIPYDEMLVRSNTSKNLGTCALSNSEYKNNHYKYFVFIDKHSPSGKPIVYCIDRKDLMKISHSYRKKAYENTDKHGNKYYTYSTFHVWNYDNMTAYADTTVSSIYQKYLK